MIMHELLKKILFNYFILSLLIKVDERWSTIMFRELWEGGGRDEIRPPPLVGPLPFSTSSPPPLGTFILNMFSSFCVQIMFNKTVSNLLLVFITDQNYIFIRKNINTFCS